MTNGLRDFRGKITAETDLWLDAEALATGRQRQDIAREVLHEAALRRTSEVTVMADYLRSKGIPGESPGSAAARRRRR